MAVADSRVSMAHVAIIACNISWGRGKVMCSCCPLRNSVPLVGICTVVGVVVAIQ